MSFFYTPTDFERAARLNGITDLARATDGTGYSNPHTQSAYLVWETVAQSQHARTRPPAYLIRRRGRDQNIMLDNPFKLYSQAQQADRADRGFDLPLALYPTLPRISASAEACVLEHIRARAVKGYSPELDQRYTDGQMVFAALALTDQAIPGASLGLSTCWPWDGAPMKKETPLRAIEKAVGLLISEHERLSAAIDQGAVQ